ncbi:shikimate dehydrogenase [Schaalia sp. ZJ1691]|uniref:shikimate dehydrogenase n=1 Tax=Schaalia sp. ZJ1691 TaxID=2709404 RepID=UPI0013EB8921|nr:shikimate dehydrogenase [Schaalia sp. ZJ1691]
MPWAAVIGSPIDHSLSPVLHRAAWDSLGLGDDWVYQRIDVRSEDAADFVWGIDSQCRGLSVTMPCKQVLLGAMDAVDPLAQAVGALNTVIPSAGILTGFNTDVHGIVRALEQARSSRGLTSTDVAVILGGRATASSALAALGTLGFRHVIVVARRFSGPGSVLGASMRLGIPVEQVMWADRERVLTALSQADILVSTVPRGVADDLAADLKVRVDQTLLDVVYSPRNTALRSAYERAGACVAEGTEMLLQQAMLQVRLMTGQDPDAGPMRLALAKELDNRGEAS